MSGTWIEITDARGTRRVPLGSARTRLGGGDAEVELSHVGEDQLHVFGEPLRAEFVGRGAPPFCDGEPVRERTLRPGDAIEWAGSRMVVGREASLEELHEPSPAASSAPPQAASPAGFDARTWARARAGLVVDLGRADKKVVARWQTAVRERSFDADRAAEELLASAGPLDGALLRDRAGLLLRDFLMAPLLRGVRGAGRKARQQARGLLAMIVAQGLALVVFGVLVLAGLLLLRWKGHSVDAFLDTVVEAFGELPGPDGPADTAPGD